MWSTRECDWVLLKVETDQPGLHGWGEATLEWKTRAEVGAIEDLSVLLVGQDPRRIEHLWQVMHRQYFWRGGIINMSAMSGIDQALWDIKGKDFGRPVCEFLGGPMRDSLRLYDHLGGGGTLEGMYNTAEPEVFAERIMESVERGFTAVKAMPIPVPELIESANVLKHTARCVEAMREAAGDGIEIMLDLHARTTPAAIQFGRLLSDYSLYWYEEPCWPEHVDALVEVARALPFPIATGEGLVATGSFGESVRTHVSAEASSERAVF